MKHATLQLTRVLIRFSKRDMEAFRPPIDGHPTHNAITAKRASLIQKGLSGQRLEERPTWRKRRPRPCAKIKRIS